MTATLVHTPAIGKYVPNSAVHLVADEFGVAASTAEQMLKPSDPRCPLGADSPALRMVRALVSGGRSDVAARLMLPLDLARLPAYKRDLRDLLHREQELDGAEDPAELALIENLADPAARDTYRKRLTQYRQVLDEILAAL